MDESMINKYKEELLNMYKSRTEEKSTENESAPVLRQEKSKAETQPIMPSVTENMPDDTNTSSFGKLVVMVTTVSNIYPVTDAKVTVFKGAYDNMQVIDTRLTDRSGKTEEFKLSAPNKSLSMDSDETQLPYSLYNIMVSADGFIPNVHLNVPIFSGITSLQRSDLIPTEISDGVAGPMFYNESSAYNL